MDRLEALITIEIFGPPDDACSACSHYMPSVMCESTTCPILATLQKQSPLEVVRDRAAKLRQEKRATQIL